MRVTREVCWAGHKFLIDVERAAAEPQLAHLKHFEADIGRAPACGASTRIQVNTLPAHPSRWPIPSGRASQVTPFRGEPYLTWTTAGTRWWTPISSQRTDHAYAKRPDGTLQVLVGAKSDRPHRYAARMAREVVLRCAENRGWILFHAAAAAVHNQGILIAGPSGSGKTTVLAALMQHAQANLVAAERAAIGCDAGDVIGMPLSVRVARAGVAELGLTAPNEQSPKASYTPAEFVGALGRALTETAALHLVVVPAYEPTLTRVRIRSHPEPAAALQVVCCTPFDEDWQQPWFEHRNTAEPELARAATARIGAVAATVPVVEVAFGHGHAERLRHISEAVVGVLP